MPTNNNKTPINKQFSAIDTLYWEMLQHSSYYAKTTEVSGIVGIENDKDKLYRSIENGIKKGNDYSEIKQNADLILDDVIVGAQVCGEEKGFILGFLYAAQIFQEIGTGHELSCSLALENLKHDER